MGITFPDHRSDPRRHTLSSPSEGTVAMLPWKWVGEAYKPQLFGPRESHPFITAGRYAHSRLPLWPRWLFTKSPRSRMSTMYIWFSCPSVFELTVMALQKHYAKSSPDRKALENALHSWGGMREVYPIINGQEVPLSTPCAVNTRYPFFNQIFRTPSIMATPS